LDYWLLQIEQAIKFQFNLDTNGLKWGHHS
jgi:hypothetical protein